MQTWKLKFFFLELPGLFFFISNQNLHRKVFACRKGMRRELVWFYPESIIFVKVLYQNAAKVQQKGDTVMTTVQKYAQYLMDLCCSHRVQAFFMFSIYPTRSGRASQEKQLNGGTGSGSAVDLSTNSKFLTMTLRALNVSPLTQVLFKNPSCDLNYELFWNVCFLIDFNKFYGC